MVQHAVSIERHLELDLYKRYTENTNFKQAFDASISSLLSKQDFWQVI
jgi:hypothetical protein